MDLIRFCNPNLLPKSFFTRGVVGVTNRNNASMACIFDDINKNGHVKLRRLAREVSPSEDAMLFITPWVSFSHTSPLQRTTNAEAQIVDKIIIILEEDSLYG